MLRNSSLLIASLISLLVLGNVAIAGPNEPSVAVVTLPPAQAGTVTISFFVYVDANHTHGVTYTTSAIAIPAGVTADVKAQLIAAAIQAQLNAMSSMTRPRVDCKWVGPGKVRANTSTDRMRTGGGNWPSK